MTKSIIYWLTFTFALPISICAQNNEPIKGNNLIVIHSGKIEAEAYRLIGKALIREGFQLEKTDPLIGYIHAAYRSLTYTEHIYVDIEGEVITLSGGYDGGGYYYDWLFEGKSKLLKSYSLFEHFTKIIASFDKSEFQTKK